jgi:hypothetical protein
VFGQADEDFILYDEGNYRVGIRYRARFDRWKDTLFGRLFGRK